MNMNQIDRQRQAIKERLSDKYPSRQALNSVMAEIDRLCLLVTASCLGLKDCDVKMPEVNDG